MQPALGRTTRFIVDTLGRTVATKDPNGNVALQRFDSNDRVVESVDGQNQSTESTYDGNGNLLGIMLPSGAQTSYAYDARNRLLQRTDALQQSESWTYDDLGAVSSHTDRKGKTVVNTYDELGRRTLTSYSDGSSLQATYDAGDRLTQLSDTASGTLSWAYDDSDRIVRAATPQGTITYDYDDAGRRTDMVVAGQSTVSYGYDDANRLTSLSQGSEIVRLGYDEANRRNSLMLPNGVTVNYGYDAANQITSIVYKKRDGTPLGDLAYTYDEAGRRAATRGSFSPQSLPNATTQDSRFDANSKQIASNGSQLSYDANGNLTSDDVNTYTWNARDQLTRIAQGSTTVASFAYDAIGRRVSKTAYDGETTRFLYDGAQAVQEMQGSNVITILAGQGVDERFARSDVIGRTYFLTDALNSTIALTDSTGAIRQQYSYDPYGNVTASDTTTGFTNPYQYTGREADVVGLYYYRARYYRPSVGGFISEDPLGFGGGQGSFYAYVGGNPINYLDPTGLSAQTAPIGFWGGAVGGAEAGGIDGAEIGTGLEPGGGTLLGGAVGAVGGAVVGGVIGWWGSYTSRGNVADSQIVRDYGEIASEARRNCRQPPDRCEWLEANKNRYRQDQVKATQKAWGCRRSRS